MALEEFHIGKWVKDSGFQWFFIGFLSVFCVFCSFQGLVMVFKVFFGFQALDAT